MGERILRIVLKPYSLKGVDHSAEGKAYWRACTDFNCSKNGKPVFGNGIDIQSALANLKQFIPGQFREWTDELTAEMAFPCPDHMGWYQVNLDGSKPTREQWAYEKQYYDRFGHLPTY